jgi:hypothetical protein
MTIEGVEVTRDAPCKYCNNGCTIHDNQPEDSCDFNCGWLMDNTVPEYMRPDLSGVIILAAKYCWRNLPVDMAVPTKDEIPTQSLGILQERAAMYKRPLLYCDIKDGGRDVYPYGPEQFQDHAEQMCEDG